MSKILLLAILLIAISCNKHDEKYLNTDNVINIEEYASDFQVPHKAWDILEGKSEEDSASIIRTNVNINFSEIKVVLKEVSPNIIKGEEIVISLPKGGGTIDLADYVSEENGSFYISFVYPEFVDATGRTILFLSNSRKRKIDDQIWGSGCNTLLDIGLKMNLQISADGIKVNTVRQRYVSVLSGTFLFSALRGIRYYISQVTITDSRFKHLQCKS